MSTVFVQFKRSRLALNQYKSIFDTVG